MSYDERARVRRGSGRWRHGATCVFVLSLLPFDPIPGALSAEPLPVESLKRLSLEDLANLEVTSVERRAEPLSQTPAAVYVLTAEDVQRLGATTISDALRYVPGMEVARADSQNWAVSARGFNDIFANKLLVLIDGRSVYSPLFSGVYWQYQDVLLQDLDRIEVVRGPGATVWGANAVNGVINVLTKSAAETQGLLVSGSVGTPETAAGAVRYGGRMSDTAAVRVYGKSSNWDNFPLSNGEDARDSWWVTQGGFRLDWDPSTESSFTLQGDVYGGRAEQSRQLPVLTPPYSVVRDSHVDAAGANLLGRWTRRFSPTSELQLQTYYDLSHQEDRGSFESDVHQFDVDLQHHLELGERNEAVWGVTYRLVADQFEGKLNTAMEPTRRDSHLFGTFAQDTIQWIPDRFSTTLGTKVEHNDYSAFEVQPGIRLLYTPDDRQSIWASVARAVRTPSRAEEDVVTQIGVFPPSQPGMPTSVLTVLGQDQVTAEELLAFELGYRIRPIPRLSIDVSTFLNSYDDLITANPGIPDMSTLPGYVTIPLRTENSNSGMSYGVEAAVNVQVTDWWRLRTGYTWLRVEIDQFDADRQGGNPQHQAFLVSQMDFPHHLSLDIGYRFVSRLDAYEVPAYSAFDARLGWRPSPHWEVALTGQNLFDDRHLEFGGSQYTGMTASEVPRSVLATLTWRY